MTEKDRRLLLIDLCARLPYGVKVENTSFANTTIQTLFGRVSDSEFIMLETYKQVGGEDYSIVHDGVHFTGYIENIKPYLRPMSSMTTEEEYEYHQYKNIDLLEACEMEHTEMLETAALCFSHAIDWLNAHHFDYRGIIPLGLALEAPDGMYK